MQVTDETRYRLRLSEGFLEEARQDITLRRWRSCLDNSQLACENSAKAVLSLLGPVGRTHRPAVLIRQALEINRFPESVQLQVDGIAECAELLGPDVHIETSYGDEAEGRTPWELFDEADAQQALSLADKAVLLAKQLIQGR